MELCVKTGTSICHVWRNFDKLLTKQQPFHVIMLSLRPNHLSLVSWFGYLSLKNRNSLSQTVKWSNRLIGEPQLNPATLVWIDYSSWLVWFYLMTWTLYIEFQFLRSGKKLLISHHSEKKKKKTIMGLPSTWCCVNSPLLFLHISLFMLSYAYLLPIIFVCFKKYIYVHSRMDDSLTAGQIYLGLEMK